MSNKNPKIARCLQRILKRLDTTGEELDNLLWELGQTEQAEPRVDYRASPPPDPASSLVVALRLNGGSRLAVNGGVAFDLPPRLTKLLLFALSGQEGPDGIRSYRLLSEATGEKALDCTPNALSSLVYQLRQKLKSHGLHPRLLDTTGHPAMIRFLARNVVVIVENSS